MLNNRKQRSASEFKDLPGVTYFEFEEEFIEKNIRCIPMIVRFKLDKAGIKLKLDEWNRLVVAERIELARKRCSSEDEITSYRACLYELVAKRSSRIATTLSIETNPDWSNTDKVPALLSAKLNELDLAISVKQWSRLTELQRFALIKLCKAGHESKNFPKALREFGLLRAPGILHKEKEVHEINVHY